MLDVFSRLYDAIASLLAFFYSLPGIGYGAAIVLLTLAVMVVMVPLTLQATRSTLKLQAMQPELKRIQSEFKDDREALNREMMKLYQEQGINPVGGCLPMFAQIPVFLVLFQVVRGLTRRVEEEAFFHVANVIRSAQGAEPLDGGQFDPKYLSTDSEMYRDLQGATEMAFGPFDLAAEAREVFFDDFVGFLPYLLLILFVIGTSYYQQRQIMARRGSSAAAANPQQQAIMRVLPLVTGVTSFIFPAALVVYFAVSNLFRIGQQAYITRRFYGDADSAAAAAMGVSSTETNGSKESGTAAATSASSEKQRRRSSSSSAEVATDNAADGMDAVDGAGVTSDVESERTNAAKPAGDRSRTSADREAAWAERRRKRQQAAKKKPKPAAGKGATSSRVTPKGTRTQPKKRKR